MLAKLVAEIPPGLFYEPKWDGFRAIVERDGDAVEIHSRNLKPMARYFPDLVAALRSSLPSRCVIDGEIVVIGPAGRLDFFALQQRVHPAASRVDRLAAETPASFIAFDLLDDLALPFAERRAALERLALAPPLFVTPVTRDLALAREWFERFEGAGLDGVIAKDGAHAVPAGRARDVQGQAPAHRRLRRLRLPAAQDGARRDRLAPARVVPGRRGPVVGASGRRPGADRRHRLLPDGPAPRAADRAARVGDPALGAPVGRVRRAGAATAGTRRASSSSWRCHRRA